MSQSDTTVRVISRGTPAAAAKTGFWDTVLSYILRFVLLFVLWMVLSGMYDAFHLSLGAFCCGLVVWLSEGLVPPEVRRFRSFRAVVGLALYIPWLVWEIAKANFHMLRIVFHPRMYDLINPRVVHFKTGLRSNLGLTFLANSITMTPGTITVSIDRRGYVSVHAIDDQSAEGVPGDMERKLKAVFEED
jgi:multicomponent Na+:H+ antiporter subunit E